MKSILLSIFILVLTHFTFAGYRIYSGATLSNFNINKSQPRFGGNFGIDKTWDGEPYSLALGLQFITKSTYTTGNAMVFNLSNQGYYFDALFSVGYLEAPLMGIIHLLSDNNIKIGLTFGPSVAIAILDNSKWYNSVHFDFEQDSEFMYKLEDRYHEADEVGAAGGVFLNAGFIAEYQQLYIELRYSHGMTKLGALAGVVMNDEKFRTLGIVFGVHF